jgi:hypothetical protein
MGGPKRRQMHWRELRSVRPKWLVRARGRFDFPPLVAQRESREENSGRGLKPPQPCRWRQLEEAENLVLRRWRPKRRIWSGSGRLGPRVAIPRSRQTGGGSRRENGGYPAIQPVADPEQRSRDCEPGVMPQWRPPCENPRRMLHRRLVGMEVRGKLKATYRVSSDVNNLF